MLGGTSQILPVVETPPAKVPLHLRYFALLRANANFRRLWLAQLISEIGDWFYSLAIYDFLLQTTNSGKAVGWAIIIQTLPWFLMTPLAGHIADRFSRRRLMVLADIVRAFIVLGLLGARAASDVWLVYLLLAFEQVFAAIFEPARNGLLPNVVSGEELLPANAISSATWSFALMIGGAMGGAVTALLGRRVAFIVNSGSFLVSAMLVGRIRARETHLEPASESPERASSASGLRSLQDGARYLQENPRVVLLVLAKTGLGWMGGMLLLLTVFGERVFPVAGQGALAMGLLYAARGVGAAVGPFLGDHLTRGIERRMWQAIGAGLLVIGCCYIAFSRAPNLPLALLAVFCAHIGGSNVWVMSTTLLQLNVRDQFRGRVFALDAGMIMLMISVSNYLVGTGLDDWGFAPRTLAAALGGLILVPGIVWWMVQARWGKAPSD
jgi:MFS family permease